MRQRWHLFRRLRVFRLLHIFHSFNRLCCDGRGCLGALFLWRRAQGLGTPTGAAAVSVQEACSVTS